MENRNNKFRLHEDVELPIDGMPQIVQDYINEVVRVYQCPIEFPTVAVISAFSSAIGKRVKITDGKYTNPLMLWFVNVAISGSNKTQPVKEVLKPLREINTTNHDRFNVEYTVWKADKERDESNPPVFDQLLIGDITDEARNKVLQSSTRGILGHYPEIKGYFDDMERYSKSGYVDKLLRMFDGDDVIINRKGDEKPIVITDVFMNILGDIQPGMLASTFGNPQYMTSGLNTRFLFTMPRIVEFPDREKESMDSGLVECWRSIIKQTYNNSFDAYPLIRLAAQSDSLYNEYYNRLQRKKESVNSSSEDGYLMSLYSKLQIQVQRLVGIVHLMNMIDQKASYNYLLVSDSEMEYCIRCMEYFEQAAVAVYQRICGFQPGSPKPRSQAEFIREFNKGVQVINRAAFAASIGKDPSYISRVLNN